MRRKRLSFNISKRFSKKLLPSASYALPPIVLLCFSLYFYCLSFTSSPANEPPHSLSITNHSSLELHSISITNHSSLSSSPPPPVYEKPCDYTNGRWVRTKRGPLYNATNCPNMKEKQNCIANGRPDLGYLNWRWKPSECHLPRFDPNTFLQLISNKHVAFIGDSIQEPPTVPPLHVKHCYRTKWIKQRRKIRRPPHYNKIYLDRVNIRWEKDIDQMDIIVLSLGHWFLVPSVIYWGDKVIGCLNRPVSNFSNCTTKIGFYGPIRRALRTSLNSIIKRKVKKGNGIDVIVRTYSPSHFEGAWDKGGICSKTKPYREGERQLEGEDAEIRRIQLEELERAKEKAKKFRRFRLEVLDVTKLALLRPDGHPGAYMNPFPFANGIPKSVQNDCVHWCLRGPIDTWNEVFLQMMKNMARTAKE
ncbi:hypothetical protein glysoja_045974 [Glycine soja]|uniref:Uncharacterized protein n=1 Tax=Glycine soja TaxID=3848 RepID=A0A0B2PL97_GLYSO|nr:hypothetical protein glysoja_045974 [Glycine soja]